MHFEVVTSLTSGALRQFVARTVPIAQIFRNNGMNFVGVSKVTANSPSQEELQRRVNEYFSGARIVLYSPRVTPFRKVMRNEGKLNPSSIT